MAQPSPALRGFTKELGAINGSQSDPQQQANAALIVALRNAAPSLIATAREAEGLRALLARAYDMLFNSTAASEGDTTTIILERSEWLRLQEKLCRSALSEKGIHASDATDPGDSEVEGLRAEVARLKAERDTPQVANFTEAVHLEAAHQRARWGAEHDAGKTPFDWFWLIGYLAQKAADAGVRGDVFKAQHHTISTAAALANWHTALGGGDDAMRPGIMPREEAQARAALEGEEGDV